MAAVADRQGGGHTRRFTFRAQAALDLRKRQDDDAQRALAELTAARRTAEQAVEDATAAVDRAMLVARDAQKAAQPAAVQEWHRNWIVSRRDERDARCATLTERQHAERQAQTLAADTRRRLRSLERWFDRAWRAYQRDARRAEQRELDALGAMRYAARRWAPGGD